MVYCSIIGQFIYLGEISVLRLLMKQPPLDSIYSRNFTVLPRCTKCIRWYKEPSFYYRSRNAAGVDPAPVVQTFQQQFYHF